jgi:hypothetical protein
MLGRVGERPPWAEEVKSAKVGLKAQSEIARRGLRSCPSYRVGRKIWYQTGRWLATVEKDGSRRERKY